MRQLRRYSFSIVLTLSIVGISALYYYTSRSGVELEAPEITFVEQREGTIPGTRSQRAILSVYSEPANAAVIMMGDTVGRTPLIEHRLQAGVYVVTVAKKNFRDRDTVVVLRGNQAGVYEPQLRRIYRDERRAQVEAQETKAERSSRPPPSVQQGPTQEAAAVAEVLPQNNPARETSADSSREKEGKASVEAPTTGILRLNADPENTTVEINGEVVGRTPLRLPRVPSGIHEVIFAHPGYETLTKQVEVRAGGEVSLGVSLDAHPGLLRVLVEPWGSIFINQQRRARSTDVWYQTDVPAGTHEISVHHPSLGKKARTVEVTPGDTLSVVFDMWEK